MHTWLLGQKVAASKAMCPSMQLIAEHYLADCCMETVLWTGSPEMASLLPWNIFPDLIAEPHLFASLKYIAVCFKF